MAGQVKLKRSSVPGKVPTTASMAVGELALNTYDGRAFMKGNDGINDFIRELTESITSTATAGGTTTLTATSTTTHRFTGTLPQTLALPAANTLRVGQPYHVLNRSTDVVTVTDSTGAVLLAIAPSAQATFRVAANTTAAGTWDIANLSGGGGSGGTGINYLSSASAEAGLGGGMIYDQGAGVTMPASAGAATAPTGGRAGILTLGTTGVNPLRGSKSFTLTKTAVNAQGLGVAWPFTADRADLGRVVSIRFDMRVDSGTFLAGDLVVYVVDMAAGAPVIQAAPHQILPVVGSPGRFQGTVQLPVTGTSYRLAFHVASTNAAAWGLTIDNIEVGPQPILSGYGGTDWASPTVNPVFYDGATVVAPTGATYKWKKNGQDIEVMIDTRFQFSSASTGNVEITLPNGLVPDNAAIGACVGMIAVNTNVAPAATIAVMAQIVNGRIRFRAKDGSNNLYVNWADVRPGSDNYPQFYFKVPVTGWSSGQVLSGDADTRVVAASAVGASPTALAVGFNMLGFPGTDLDTHGTVTATGTSVTTSKTGWYYTCPIAGQYLIAASVQIANITLATTGQIQLYVYKNGNNAGLISTVWGNGAAGQYPQVSGTILLNCKASDYIEIVVRNVHTAAVTVNSAFASIHRLSGPAQIAASESVSFKRRNGGGSTIPDVTSTTIPWGTSVLDSHGTYEAATNSWVAPMPGTYQVNVGILFANRAFAAGDWGQVELFVDGGSGDVLARWVIDTAITKLHYVSGTRTIKINAGARVSIRVFQDNAAGTDYALQADARFNIFEIIRVGN
jgi:hypothetical protein